MWLLLIGLIVGLGLGAKYHDKLMPMVNTVEGWISSAKKAMDKSA
jgi:hypothetical protein